MKPFCLACVVVLALVAGAACADDVGSENQDSVEAAPVNAIKLESSSIDLFADVLVVNDIGGKVDGVYDDANAALLSAIVHDAKAILAGKVVIADAKLTNGMLLGDDSTLVYAHAGKATAARFEGHATEDSSESLAPKQTMTFFRSVIDNPSIAPTYSVLAGRERGQRHPQSFPVTIPTGGLGGSSRYLLFVQASARHVPFGKTLAIGLATAAASSGTYYMMLMSGGSVNVALIDKQSSRVLWAMQRPIREFNQIQIATLKLVQGLNRNLVSNTDVAANGILPTSSDTGTAAISTDYRSLKEAKLALRAGAIDRVAYDLAAEVLEGRYRETVDGLTKKKQSGEISDAAFDILSVKARLEYTGASSG